MLDSTTKMFLILLISLVFVDDGYAVGCSCLRSRSDRTADESDEPDEFSPSEIYRLFSLPFRNGDVCLPHPLPGGKGKVAKGPDSPPPRMSKNDHSNPSFISQDLLDRIRNIQTFVWAQALKTSHSDAPQPSKDKDHTHSNREGIETQSLNTSDSGAHLLKVKSTPDGLSISNVPAASGGADHSRAELIEVHLGPMRPQTFMYACNVRRPNNNDLIPFIGITFSVPSALIRNSKITRKKIFQCIGNQYENGQWTAENTALTEQDPILAKVVAFVKMFTPLHYNAFAFYSGTNKEAGPTDHKSTLTICAAWHCLNLCEHAQKINKCFEVTIVPHFKRVSVKKLYLFKRH